MSIARLLISNVRNLSSISFDPHHQFNLISGMNGSGKTSLLESLYLLGTGKSFKTHEKQHIIQNSKPSLSVFAEYHVDNSINKIGVERNINSALKIHINNERNKGIADLAALLPIQIITTNSHRIFHDGPKARRQFIDKGLFHVNHEFIGHWKNYQRALKQRNASLKARENPSTIKNWDIEITKTGNKITSMRKEQIQLLKPIINKLYTALTGNSIPINFSYKQGWEECFSLDESLEKNFENDRRAGFTTKGPHRSDLEITTSNNTAIKDYLSQGQQKLVAYALNIAQSQLLLESRNKKSIYLIDDLPAELDEESIENVCKTLISLQTQCFITAIHKNNINHLFPSSSIKMFHMKQGEIVG
jgi:DNA replication and repair protein RecF